MISREIDPGLITAIESALQLRQAQLVGREIRFVCLAHDDHDPSARWNGDKHVWHCDVCGAGGGAIDLAKHLGIDVGNAGGGLTVNELALTKALPVDLLRDFGVRDGKSRGQPCVEIPYSDLAGEVIAVHKRLRLTGEPRFIWRKGDHVSLYGLGALAEARESDYVIIVEGETDVWACRHAGVPAVGVPGATVFKSEWADLFIGIAHVFIWREPGQGGDAFARRIGTALTTAKVIVPPDVKDPSELWLRLRDKQKFQERMSELAHAARYWSAVRDEEQRGEAGECFAQAQALLESPTLFSEIQDAIRGRGYAGDLTPPMIAYVAITSRLLDRPLNVAFIAPSAAGKNRGVDDAVALMPPSAYHLEKAGSARALIYNDESYEHRTVIVAEADSIPQDDGPAASAIRSLAADSSMQYDVVEKDTKGAFKVRHIVKPGPTGLITTSTKALGHQLDTRMLTVSVADSPGQTRSVMLAHAAAVNGDTRVVGAGALQALQRWLELGGKHKVVVPFARQLARLVPDRQVRMRRDFRQLLTAVQAIALLYQRQRECDDRGRIIATLADYAYARELMQETFKLAASGGLSATVRETAAAVHGIWANRAAGALQPPLPVTVIATMLGVGKTTAWYRVKRAVQLGYLVNEETRKGRPAQIVPGDPLPDDDLALPSVADLEADSDDDGIDLPDSTRTVEPDPESEAEPAVQGAVQPAPEPVEPAQAARAVRPRREPFEPPLERDGEPPEPLESDSDWPSDEPAVQRFNVLRDDEAATNPDGVQEAVEVVRV
jgi:hypothetical protein